MGCVPSLFMNIIIFTELLWIACAQCQVATLHAESYFLQGDHIHFIK